jgi:hypothetical protein
MLIGTLPRTISSTSARKGSFSPFFRRTVRRRAAAVRATATFSFAVLPVRSSWKTTGTPSADSRTSNSIMSAPPEAARANAAGEFSSARSDAPRCATKTGRPGSRPGKKGRIP